MPFLPFYSFIPEILGKFAHTLYKILFYLCSYIIKYKNLMDKITIYLLEEKQAKRKGGLYLEMVE